MKNRTAVYDQDLRLEAQRFQGVARPFPNHFHEHYVIGLVESGRRTLTCKDRTYAIGPGSILLFNPGDSHACVQSDGGVLDYRSLSVSQPSMLAWTAELTGEHTLPAFAPNALQDESLAHSLRRLHEFALTNAGSFAKEEALLRFLTGLLRRCGSLHGSVPPDCPQELEHTRQFIASHYSEQITLDQFCWHSGMSKSTLLRTFTRAHGVTPYRYLESVRIDRAKALLAQGVPLPEAALRTGFADQSHFTNYFTSFTGLSPGVYRDMFGGASKED